MVIDIDRNDTKQEHCLQLLTGMINTDQFGHYKEQEKNALVSAVFFRSETETQFLKKDPQKPALTFKSLFFIISHL